MCDGLTTLAGQYTPSDYARGYADGWNEAVEQYGIDEDTHPDGYDEDDTEEYDGEIYEGEALDEVFAADQYPPDDDAEENAPSETFNIAVVCFLAAVLAAGVAGLIAVYGCQCCSSCTIPS